MRYTFSSDAKVRTFFITSKFFLYFLSTICVSHKKRILFRLQFSNKLRGSSLIAHSLVLFHIRLVIVLATKVRNVFLFSKFIR